MDLVATAIDSSSVLLFRNAYVLHEGWGCISNFVTLRRDGMIVVVPCSYVQRNPGSKILVGPVACLCSLPRPWSSLAATQPARTCSNYLLCLFQHWQCPLLSLLHVFILQLHVCVYWATYLGINAGLKLKWATLTATTSWTR
jgi:hypothetical protein